jgi:hypothetical protein
LVDVGNPLGRSKGEFDVTLTHCSALAASEAIFHCRDGVDGVFSVNSCLFGRLDLKDTSNRTTALMLQDGASSGRLNYIGSGNVYYGLTPFFARMDAGKLVENAATLDSFHRRLGVADNESKEVTRTPWQDPDPLNSLDNRNLARAFRVNATMAALRQPGSPKKAVGVERCSWGPVYADPLPALETARVADPPARRDEKIVDPSLASSQEGVYRTLRQAIEDARPQDVIFIKHDGLLPIDSVRLERSGMDLTIRPYRGYKPILKLGNTTDSDAALFRLFDSHLRLEGLQIHLAPGGMNYKSQAVVAMMGDGQLSMKDCLVTLEKSRETPMYVVLLADPNGVLRMDQQPSGQAEPRVQLDNCYIRGAGDLMFVRASRPFELRVENSLVALDGSFLMVDGSSKDPGMRNRSEIVLKQVTTYLTDHLIWLRASRQDGRTSKGLIPTYVQSATDCVFASATGKTLVHLDGFDADEQMKRCFSWGDSKRILYANYDQLLDQRSFSEGEMMPPTPYGRTEWGEFTRDPDVRFDRLRFPGLSAQDVALAKLPATDFRMKTEAGMQGYGAELERLPQAGDENKSPDDR